MTAVRSPGASCRDRTTRFLTAPAFLSSLLVAVVILAANAIYLLRIRSNNPLLYYSGLGSPGKGIVRGTHTIDLNEGVTAQALGRLAAQFWQHGHVPLWNHFEGLGQPLAGEMQSAAFFVPFILLQLLPNGIFVMHLALEFVAGFGTLLFLRSLRLSWVAATCGACLFGLNGAFSVMTNAPFNPIAFLPVALWGIELIVRAVREGRRPRAGVWVTALAIAYMLYAGFPETAFLEMLFVAIWALARLVGLPGHRRSFALWSIVGAVAGIAMAAPILIAFKDFLDFGFTAYHADVANNLSYPIRQFTSFGIPYAAGPLTNPVFGVQAGYVTLSALLLGLVGLAGKRHRGLKVLLGVTVLVLLLNMFGFRPAKEVLNLIPGIRSILVYKYGLAIIELAVVILAAYGIDDIARSRVRRSVALCAIVVAGGYLIGSVVYLRHGHYFERHLWSVGMLGWTVAVLLTLAVLLVIVKRASGRAGLVAVLAAILLTMDAAGTYAVPQLSASRPASVDLAPVRFLQANLGTSRFYTVGPIAPNYGSYFGISQLNANDLPVPKKYSSFVLDNLRPPAGTPGAKGTEKDIAAYQLVPFNPKVKQERVLLTAYGQQQRYFRQAGVKYVVMRRGVSDASTGSTYGLARVFRDAKVEIWDDTAADPYYSTSGAQCRVRRQNRDGVTLDCPRPATLLRRELSSPGWTATVNGSARTVADNPSTLFQLVRVPAGVSTVTYSYLPPHFVLAVVASGVVVVLMLLDGAFFLVLRRRSQRRERNDTES
ncbi:MAG: hypothetical protein M3Y49_11610 [Actinomycetota bacterium]|nr:hypothetical protein [Actinomycetota bacterium]